MFVANIPNIGAIFYESPSLVNSTGIPGSSWLKLSRYILQSVDLAE